MECKGRVYAFLKTCNINFIIENSAIDDIRNKSSNTPPNNNAILHNSW